MDNPKTINFIFEGIKGADVRKGMAIYSQIELSIDSLRTGIAPWVYKVAYHFFEKADFIPIVAAEDFKIAMEKEVLWITSDAAGKSKLSKAQASLTGTFPLANAFKKVHNTLELDGDLRQLTTVSQCEKYNKERNADLKALKTKNKMKEDIRKACIVNLLRDHPEMKNVDFLTDESASSLLDDYIKEYEAKRDKGEHLELVEGDKGLTEQVREPDQFDKMGNEVASVLRQLYLTKVDEFGGNENTAINHINQTLASTMGKWETALDASKSKLKDSLEKQVS